MRTSDKVNKNNYAISADVLRQASAAIQKNADVHGDTFRSFEMIGQMWSTYILHIFTVRGNRNVTPFDVANMMAMVKQVRSVYGDGIDNQVDAAGYSALAAMLNPLTNVPPTEDDEIYATISSKLNERGNKNEPATPVQE